MLSLQVFGHIASYKSCCYVMFCCNLCCCYVVVLYYDVMLCYVIWGLAIVFANICLLPPFVSTLYSYLSNIFIIGEIYRNIPLCHLLIHVHVDHILPRIYGCLNTYYVMLSLQVLPEIVEGLFETFDAHPRNGLIDIHVYICVCVYMYIYIYIYIYIYTCMHTYITYIHNIHTYIHTYIHTDVCIYIYICIHI